MVIWSTVRKHWSVALATALAISLAVAFYTLGQKKIYQSSATVQFDPNPPRPLGKGVETVVELGTGTYWSNREYFETQYKIIQSMRVALTVVKDLGLNKDPAFLQNAAPGATPAPREATEEQAAQILKQRLRVEPIKDSRLAYIKYEDADPARAQRVLNTIVDVYISLNLEDALSSTTSAVEWLRGQLDKLKVDLESSELALHDYKEQKNILSVDIDDQSNMLREEMKQLNDALTSVRTKREELSARRAELAKIKPEDPSSHPASELLHSSLLQELRKSYEAALRDRDAEIGSGKGEKHPDVLAADARVHATRAALLAEVRNIQRALDADLAVVKRHEAGLSALFERAKKQALELNLLGIEYNRLRRSKDNTEKLYSLVLERTKESDLTRMLRVNNIRVVDRPLLPRQPIRPQVLLNLVAGIVSGLVFGVAAAMAKTLLDRSVKTPEDVEHELGITSLGLLPEIDRESRKPVYYGRRRRSPLAPPSSSRELIVHERPASGIAEASRAIRTNLLFMSPDHPYRTLLVTSAGPAEGKTTVACCIAIAMAQAGQRVVIIDCDLRRPRLHRIFRRSSDLGVTSALLDGASQEHIQATEVPNLSVIPAGPIPPNPAELFHSERFKTFLQGVVGKFDRVILDSPPVIAVTDAAILSTLTDGTVLVIRSFVTSKDVVRHALRSLRDVGGRVIGGILNAVDFGRGEYKYSYYYKRGEYYSEISTAAEHGRREESAAPTQH